MPAFLQTRPRQDFAVHSHIQIQAGSVCANKGACTFITLMLHGALKTPNPLPIQ